MKKIFVMLLILAFAIMIIGCDEKEISPEDKCGDTVCDPVELKNGICPLDCGEVPGLSPVIETEAAPEPDHTREDGVLYLALMVHLEGWDEAPDNEIQFDRWTELTREVADLLEQYDAKGTFEMKPNFVEACENWDDNVASELYDRGHGIGIHADVGGPGTMKTGLTVEQMTAQIAEMKVDGEALLGHEIRHVSGICSSLDWVQAASQAGYEFTTGGVAMCGNSLDPENLPAGWTQQRLLEEFHNIFPDNLGDRVHPWRSSDASNWLEHDPNGEIVIFASDGVIEGMYEFHNEEIEGAHKTGEFNQDDLDQYIETLEEALEYSYADEVNMLYVALSIGNGADLEVFEQWLQSIEPYVESGQVEWKSLPEIYDAYVAME